MADGTIIQVGNFVSTGANVALNLRSGVDWISTVNMTAAAGAAINVATQTYWQLGMGVNDAFITYHAAATGVGSTTTALTLGVPGYTLFDTSIIGPSAPIATTAVTIVGGNTVVVATANTAGLAIGSIVQVNGIAGAGQLGGVPLVVSAINAGVSFVANFANNGGTAPNNTVAAAAAGFYQILANGASYWYPQTLIITAINLLQLPGFAIITTSVPSGLTVGQMVRINVPNVPGLLSSYQLNGYQAQIVSVNDLAGGLAGTNFTISLANLPLPGAVSAFAFPLTANAPFTPPFVQPFGESLSPLIAAYPLWNSNNLDDSTRNTAIMGILLGGGLSSPAGQAGDVIFWRAGKSFNT